MKRAVLISLACIVIFIVSVLVGYFVYDIINKEESNGSDVAVTDECIEEVADEEQEEEIDASLEASSNSETKISPNAILMLKKYYENCKHWVTEYTELPPELINMTEKDLENEYPEWELEKFSQEEIILTKTSEGYCEEHYILKDEGGKVSVYKIKENGEEVLQEQTDIATEYLTETDLLNIKNGIKVYGKDNLNSMLEDFE